MPYQNEELKSTMFLSHCFTGTVYIRTVVNIVKIGITDTVSMTVSGKYYTLFVHCVGFKEKKYFRPQNCLLLRTKRTHRYKLPPVLLLKYLLPSQILTSNRTSLQVSNFKRIFTDRHSLTYVIIKIYQQKDRVMVQYHDIIHATKSM